MYPQVVRYDMVSRFLATALRYFILLRFGVSTFSVMNVGVITASLGVLGPVLFGTDHHFSNNRFWNNTTDHFLRR